MRPRPPAPDQTGFSNSPDGDNFGIKEMMKVKALVALGFGVLASVATLARPAAAQFAPAPQAQVILVADGCGPGWYRGPGGACHRFGRGPYPGGYWGPYRPAPAYAYPGRYGWNGCPTGFWRGPWGYCRDTPYHGRLPGGRWM